MKISRWASCTLKPSHLFYNKKEVDVRSQSVFHIQSKKKIFHMLHIRTEERKIELLLFFLNYSSYLVQHLHPLPSSLFPSLLPNKSSPGKIFNSTDHGYQVSFVMLFHNLLTLCYHLFKIIVHLKFC